MCVVLDGKIHEIGGQLYGSNHYTGHNVYDWNSAKWVSRASLPSARSYSAAVVYNSEIHVLGGCDSSTYSTQTHYKYNANTNTWTTLSNLPYKADGLSAVVYNGEIHILGGANGTSNNAISYSYHYKWDTGNDTWIRLGDLPYRFAYGQAVVYDDEIHILSGCEVDGDQYPHKPYHYKWDVNSDTWIRLGDLPYKLADFQAVVYNDEIHILGGYGFPSSIENEAENNSQYLKIHYKLKNDVWVQLRDLPQVASSFQAVVCGEIHILGGQTSSDSTVNCYRLNEVEYRLVVYDSPLFMKK